MVISMSGYPDACSPYDRYESDPMMLVQAAVIPCMVAKKLGIANRVADIHVEKASCVGGC